MSSGSLRSAAQPKPGQTVPSAVAPSSQAILLDKLNVRQSTPDSEALASSDEEADQLRQGSVAPMAQPQKPVRRASWLNDTSQAPINLARKGSFASSSMSPTTSHPTTPSAEQGVGTWGSLSGTSTTLGRAHGAAGASFPWNAVWGNERKDASSRLAEVLPSPTSIPSGPGANNGLYHSEPAPIQMSPGGREQAANPQIPFPIPLHPTPKTYRSQSYSVGQLEADAAASMVPSAMMGRGRTIPHSGLQHRPSRPSMLSEMASDGSTLGKVNEDDDDDSAGSMQGSQTQNSDALKIEQLKRENAMLRQQQQQYQSSRLRPRASTGTTYGLNGYLQEPVPEESDYAVDELDEANDAPDLAAKRALSRRMSEFGAGPFRPYGAFENRKLDNVKKGIWQTSLGFSGVGDISQSRRHSFADIPVPQRQNSIISLAESVGPHDGSVQEGQMSQDSYSVFSDGSAFVPNNTVSPSYFTGGGSLAGPQQAIAHSAYGQFSYASPQGPYNSRPLSPHRGMYGMSQPRQSQSLHIVLFKCSRADVFYIQEGTGLTVKPGDLVIVEADRGTDLGTVAKDNVDWQTAKELKEHYAEEHYKWLMMYSHNATAQDGTGAGLMAASNGMQASAVGGMGPPNPHHAQEPNAGELKPKLIKRLAQSHEVMALRDKEGNEAKAKRTCMTKVKEHGLNMEILDAEFQMDWKKLTFYYFADSYINFNSLVTDLFKIYKTRIWMSAINPASFASPTLGLQAPSGIGPGAVSVSRVGGQERRQNQTTAPTEPSSTGFVVAGPNTGNRALRPSNSHPSFNDATIVAAQPTYTAAQNYPPYNPYTPFFSRPGATVPYAQNMMQAVDHFPTGYAQPNDYHMGRGGRFQPNQPGSIQHEQSASPLGAQADWTHAFQGLSLNSR